MQNILKLFSKINASKVIAKDIDYDDYVALDLSINNTELKNHNLETAKDNEIYIQNHLYKNNAKIAYGGYLENRNLYKRSTVFKNDISDERNIHIGLDLWINEQAPIYAALEGKIHSFQNNIGLGDYGPTIIIAHQLNGIIFHTLYGHLSLESLTDKNIGDKIESGQQIGTLGLPPLNGDYAPHLHFQIIIDMENKKGDYPGVCSKERELFYKENCPNPELLLKIN